MLLNVERCIELHNSIVSHARSHLPPHHQPRIQRSWFAAHNLDPSSLDSQIILSDGLKAFLSGIDIVVPEDHQHLAFSPFLIGIPSPNGLRPDDWEGSEDYDDEFILLYKSTRYDPGGLVMSLTTHQVCYTHDIFDNPRERLWGDLYTVLEIYKRCIDSGKFVVDANHPGFGDQEGLVTQGWRFEEWTDGELDLALSRWASLVDAIVGKMPTQADEVASQSENDSDGLIPASVLDLYPAIPPFARAFLSRAKKPPFTSIAPQLQVPDVAFIHRVGSQLREKYPEASLTTPQHSIVNCPSFLLFPWRTPGVQFASRDDSDRWQLGNPSRVLDNRAGLYLVPDNLHAHASTLLLPFSVGGNGHVLRGDGTTVERPGQDVLYQHGICNPFVPDHSTPLAAILVNWWEQVENEDWAVDENGVVGGEDLWRLADMEEDAENFMIEWVCF